MIDVTVEYIFILYIWGDIMIQSVFTIGIVLTVVLVIVGFLLTKASLKGNYSVYYPFLAVFGIGLILLLFATIIEKVKVFGEVGLGGLGIACLFSAAIALIVTSILDAYASQEA